MSNLTEALDRILNWLQRQKREHPQATEEWWIRSPEEKNNAPFVKPGLSLAEIAEVTKDMQQKFPPEVYQLYQWRNGSYYGNSMFDFDWLFNVDKGWGLYASCGFYPLQILARGNLRWEKRSILSLFVGQDFIDGYLIWDEDSQSFPIVFMYSKAGSDETIIKYVSLTAMMLTMADCYEQAYYIDADGHLIKDENKVLEIWKKYNSNQILR